MDNQSGWQFDDTQTHQTRRQRVFNQHRISSPKDTEDQAHYNLYQYPYADINCTVYRISGEHGSKYVTKLGNGNSSSEPLTCLEGRGSITNRIYTRDEIIKFVCEVCSYNNGDNVWIMYSKPSEDRFASFENIIEEIVIGAES